MTMSAGREAAGDLHIVAIGDADRDGLAMGGAVGADDHDGLGAVLRGEDGGGGDLPCLRDGLARDGGFDGRADFELAGFVVDLEPDLDGGAAGVERGADERDFGRDRVVDAGDVDFGFVADLQLLREALREMGLGEQGRGVHDGEERRAGGGGFTGKERAVGDDAVDGAANFGVADLGFGALNLPSAEVS